MNRFKILKDVADNLPPVKSLQRNNFIFGMKSWHGHIIDKNTISMDIDESTYKLLSSGVLARIEINDKDSFKIIGFTMDSILSTHTYQDVNTLDEMVRVVLQGKCRLIGSQL
jgi:hypothetical protein